MTDNTSATGGYLAPTTAAPAADDALENILHDAIVGITGLPATLVRPRWQRKPPNRPEASVDWVAFSVSSEAADWSASIVHRPAGDGSDEETTFSTVEVLVSFYGDNSNGNAMRLRDGLCIPQNFESLSAAGLEYLEAGPIIAAPEFVNTVWIRRRDITVRLRRAVTRVYPIRNLLSAEGAIVADDGDTNAWNTEN